MKDTMKLVEYKLGEISQPKQWSTISKTQLTGSGYPVYGANGKIGFYNEYNHEKETVVVTCRGATCGNVNITEPYSYVTGNAMSLDNVNEDIINKKYLFYLLKYRGFSDVITGTAQPQIVRQNLQNIILTFPEEKNIQEKIAKLLDDSVFIKQNRKKSLILADEFLRSTFLEMFGEPVFNNKDWKMKPFSDIIELDRNTIEPDKLTNSVNYIGLEDIESKTGKIKNVNNIDANKLKSSKFTFDTKHVLYGKLRPYLNKVALPKFRGICSTDIIPILPKYNISNREFIAYLMRHKGFVSFANNRSTGANLPRISPEKIKEFDAICPSIELQNKFAEIVEKTERLKKQYEQSLSESENLFNSLMQRAFKGEL